SRFVTWLVVLSDHDPSLGLAFEVAGFPVYRYNQELVVNWLKKRIDTVSACIDQLPHQWMKHLIFQACDKLKSLKSICPDTFSESSSLGYAPDSKSAISQQLGLISPEMKLWLSCQVVCDYLPDDLAKTLRDSLNLSQRPDGFESAIPKPSLEYPLKSNSEVENNAPVNPKKRISVDFATQLFHFIPITILLYVSISIVWLISKIS
ncbi:unnamed protein product, partial [Protopolystoma xenopodis]